MTNGSKTLCTILVGGLVCAYLALSAYGAEFAVRKAGDSVVDAQALTIVGRFGPTINGLAFQQDVLVTHGEYQYLGYYDAGRRVCLARRRLPTGDWEVIRFPDYHFKSNDAHNTISIGICEADGTIQLSWDHHVHALKYRRSKPDVTTKPGEIAWDAKLFMDKDDNAYLIFGVPRSPEKMQSGIYFPDGDLVIMAATADATWTDWQVIHTETGPFLNEMLGDLPRWKASGVLSVMVQESPAKPGAATPLRVLDFTLGLEK